MDQARRFAALLVRQGLLSPAEAQGLIEAAARSGQPPWELLRQQNRLGPEAWEALRRAWAAEEGPAPAEDLTPTLRPDPGQAPGTVVSAPRPSGPDGGQRYTLLGELGRGGMGRVLRARDPALGREVAQKVLLADAATPAQRRRFLAEARVTGQLEHPNIVPVHELSDDATAPSFTMKLVRGRSLADLLRSGRETPDAAEVALPGLARTFLKVCDAVAYAHSRGVIHRDLKPANVMLGDFGEVLVMDWGLARVRGQPDEVAPTRTSVSLSEVEGAAPELTREGDVLGTPAYMPPEQVEGEREAIDERSDVYALGAILYELLALRPAFSGDSVPAILKRVLFDPPPAPGRVAPRGRRVPRELEAVALKALAKEPAARYPDVPALAADVTAWLEGRSPSALPAGPLRRALKWAARHQELSAAASVSLVLLLSLAAGGAVLLQRKERERMQQAERRAEEATRRMDAESARAQEATKRMQAESARAEAEAARAKAEEERAAADRARAEAAQRRAKALVPYLRVASLVERNLGPEGLLDHVVPALQEAVRLDPTFVEGHLRLGEALLHSGERQEEGLTALAEADAQQRAAGLGGSPRALYLTGRVLETSDPPRAAQAFQRAAALDPADPAARAAQVFMVVQAGQVEQGLARAEALVDEHPWSSEAIAAYAYALGQEAQARERAGRSPDTGKLAPPIGRLTRALNLLEPNTWAKAQMLELHHLRGALRHYAGQHLEAVGDNRAAVRLCRELGLEGRPAAVILTWAGSALALAGEDQEGLELLAEAGRAAPEDTTVPLLVARIHLARSRPREALEVLRPWLKEPRRVDIGIMALTAAAELPLPPHELLAVAEAWVRQREDPRGPQKLTLEHRFEDLPSRQLAALNAARLAARAAGRQDLLATLQRELTNTLGGAANTLAQARDLSAPAAEELASLGLAAAEALGDEADLSQRLNLLSQRARLRMARKDWAGAAKDLRRSLDFSREGGPELRPRAAVDLVNLALARCGAELREGTLPAPVQDEVLGLLEEAVGLGFAHPQALQGPLTAPLQGTPRFQRLLERMRGR